MYHHVSLELRAADADAEVAFWQLLGFTEVEPHESLKGRARWLQADDGTGHQLHLLFTDLPAIPAGGHIAIVRPAYQAALAAVRAAGFEVRDHTPYWDSPRAFARSPAGHRTEIMEFAPRQQATGDGTPRRR